MRVLIQEPLFLLLFPAAVLVLLAAARGTHWGGRRGRWLWGLRLAAVALAVLALARPELHTEATIGRRVIAVDISRSLSAAQRRGLPELLAGIPGDEGGTIRDYLLFDGRTQALARPPRSQTVVEPRTADGSDVTGALTRAGAILSHAPGSRVLLVSDGGGLDARAERALRQLERQGVVVDGLPIEPLCSVDAAVTAVETSGSAHRGQTVRVRVSGEARGVERCRVALAVRASDSSGPRAAGAEREVGQREVAVRQGRFQAEFELPLSTGSDSTGSDRNGAELSLVAQVAARGDERSANDRLQQFLAIEPPQRIAVVSHSSRQRSSFEAFLGAQGFAVLPFSETELEPLVAELPDLDLIVLDDLPAEHWPSSGLGHLAAWIRAGGALLMCGREGAFGTGGYSQSELEPLLPVSFEQLEQRRDPSVTLVIIIDTSGSMMGERVQLAKEIARAAIKKLRPHDKAGIVEFHGAKRWAAPIQPAANAIDLERALNRLQAGGGTVIFPALEEAYFGLQNVTTRYKHVLILTDGGVESGPFEGLLRRMADRGMTVSTVGVGAQGHSKFLLNLAHWGRGRYYSAPSRFYLPEVRLKQPSRSSLPPFVDGRFELRETGRVDCLRGLSWSPPPILGGFVEARPKEEARTLLESSRGDAVYVRWRAGLGKAAVFLSEPAGPWAGELVSWSDYGRMWAQLLRDLAPEQGPLGLDLSGVPSRHGVALTLRGLRGESLPQGEVVMGDGNRQLLTWVRRGPGDATAWVAFEGQSSLTIRCPAARRATVFRPPLPDERPQVLVAERLRAFVAGAGGTLVTGEAPLPPVGLVHSEAVHALFSILLLAALGIYLLEILVRRL